MPVHLIKIWAVRHSPHLDFSIRFLSFFQIDRDAEYS